MGPRSASLRNKKRDTRNVHSRGRTNRIKRKLDDHRTPWRHMNIQLTLNPARSETAIKEVLWKQILRKLWSNYEFRFYQNWIPMILPNKHITISISRKLYWSQQSVYFRWTPLDYCSRITETAHANYLHNGGCIVLTRQNSCILLLIYMKPLFPYYRNQLADPQGKSTYCFPYEENILPNYLSANPLTAKKWFLILVNNSKI